MKDIPTDGIIQTEILNPESTFILVSYYWGKGRVNKGSIYKLTYDQQVERLIKDCKKHKVNYYFVRYPSLEKSGMYMEALGLKPYFIKHAMDVFPSLKCIFVDTDLRLHRYPHLFEIDGDCWFLNWNEIQYDCYNPLQLELPGAILGFANTHNARAMLEILMKTLNVRYAEDKTFSGVITRNFLNIYTRCVWLPENYMYMFSGHTYEPGKGYTKIVNYKEELEGGEYKMSDIVFAHEDFETGALDDVYKERVGRSRWPPNVDRQLGQKLRCYDMKFRTYIDWGLTALQTKQLKVDAKLREAGKLIKVTNVPGEKTYKFPNLRRSSAKMFNENVYTVVTFIDDANREHLPKFVASCEKFSINYVIFKVDDASKINKPLALYKIMKNNPTTVVVYMDVRSIIKKEPEMFKVKSMDFMTINLNSIYSMSNCYDPRILKTLNDNVIYLSNNNLVREFLLIWAEFNNIKAIRENLQHKSLEYAFNVSNAVNKMRCYWFSKDYVMGKVLWFNGKSKDVMRNSYKEQSKKVKRLTGALEQCGLKPSRSTYSEPYAVHRYGSRGKRGINKYGKSFLL